MIYTVKVIKAETEQQTSGHYAETLIKAAELRGESLEKYLSEHPSAYKLHKKLCTLPAGATIRK
jgi:hypothetical protein